MRLEVRNRQVHRFSTEEGSSTKSLVFQALSGAVRSLREHTLSSEVILAESSSYPLQTRYLWPLYEPRHVGRYWTRMNGRKNSQSRETSSAERRLSPFQG
ncbi:hypothetical protein PM082_003938 [Marasmius tenuissimus]|nr:hypothetical protein PM082_003938 [Marasmius tenuissimus]